MNMEQKKRGRKPKVESSAVKEENPIPVIILSETVDEVVVPKKRGRKPKNKLESLPTNSAQDDDTKIKHQKKNINSNNIIVVNKLLSNESSFAESEVKKNIILHLPINSEITNIIQDCQVSSIYDSNYENNAWDGDGSLDKNDKKMNDDINLEYENLLEMRKNDFDISKVKSMGTRKPADYTMQQFMECNKKKMWPQKTNIYCFNCCHPFDHTPAALPFKYQNGIFHVYGNFCYPECAAAFNFFDIMSVGNANENYNLLNTMYKIAYNNPFYRVKIPGHRTCLKIFGGHQDIDDYRASFNNDCISSNIIMPPVMSILPIQEETNVIYYKKNVQAVVNNSKGYDGAKKKEDFALKRNKPLINKQNTLDSCMNITVDT